MRICHTLGVMRDINGFSQFKAALFDVDGTLVDSLQVAVTGVGDGFEYATGTRPSDEFLNSIMGVPLREQMLMADPNAGEARLQELVQYVLAKYESYEHLSKPFEPTIEVLRLLHIAGIKTALVTSKNKVELDGFLAKFSHRSYVDAAVCSSDVPNPKPAPDSALLACQHLQAMPQDAVMIGDSLWDLRCAKAAGVKFIAVSYGATDKAALLAENPDCLFETPDELLAWTQNDLAQPCQERK